MFYFVRHGQTDFNLQKRLAGGGLDHSLNDVGHAQAEKLSLEISNYVTHPLRYIVASSMSRAHSTAEYLSRTLGVPIETERDFREWDLGDWEGRPSEEFVPLMLGEMDPTGGETRAAFYARVERAWKRHHRDEPYLIVSHGGVWLALQDILKLPRFKISNCDLVRVSGPEWRAEVLCSSTRA